jgi:hypothetical protein
VHYLQSELFRLKLYYIDKPLSCTVIHSNILVNTYIFSANCNHVFMCVLAFSLYQCRRLVSRCDVCRLFSPLSFQYICSCLEVHVSMFVSLCMCSRLELCMCVHVCVCTCARTSSLLCQLRNLIFKLQHTLRRKFAQQVFTSV